MNYAVLMHIYNEEEYIEKVLNAIIKQKKHPEYILIIDDGSKDKTAEIVHTFETEYHLIKPDYEKPAYIRRSEAFNVGLSIIKEKPGQPDAILKVDGDSVIEEYYASELLRHFHEPHTAAVSGKSTEYNKVRNLNNGAVMYRLKTLPYARTILGWDLDIELQLIEKGFNCIVDPTVYYTDLRPPSVLVPRIDKILRNRLLRKKSEIAGRFSNWKRQ